MAKRIMGSTPKEDGYRMPGEFEEQKQVWMLWPERQDNWRNGAKPVQKAYTDVAVAISRFEPVTMCVSKEQYANCRARLPEEIRVVEMASNDSWIRDCGPTFIKGEDGTVRGIDWTFNAWGGLVDGLYFPWDADDAVAQKVCEIENVDSYRTEGFVLEGGSFHVDGEGTVMTTEMCLLSEGRNPQLTREQIEEMLCSYLNCEKVIWVTDGIDPEETNGHIDDVACFIRPGEAACIYTEDEENPFYEFYDEILDICREYDVTISLGDACRPGCLADATDVCQIEELVRLGELTKRAWEKDVQVMVEGPGHVPMDQIAANMKVQQTICMGAPFYVLGPLVTDIAPGYDHITAAIGGAIAAMSGAAFLCYVTPAEHLALPNLDDVKQGIIASRIAAHAADIAKGIRGARDIDDKMGDARRALDWEAQWACALDPETAKAIRDDRSPEHDDTCSMCGKFCAVRSMNKALSGEYIDIL